jgi:protein tyrosine/serine phosphatase
MTCLSGKRISAKKADMEIFFKLRELWRQSSLWISMLFADHGFTRPVYWNSGRVTGNIWRGPQPNPFHIRRHARRGFKTILNLRGKTHYGSYELEKIHAAKYGLAMIDLPIYSGAAPRKEHIHALREVFTTMKKPVLMHCKSGADRAGLASALYLILSENVPVQEAAKQLSRSYGHVKYSKTGILDAFFAKYLEDNEKKPMPFMQWVDEVYDPQILDAAFERPTLLRTIIDFVIRRE